MTPTEDQSFIETDTLLWNHFRAGDHLAFTRLSTKYFDILFNYGYQICRDRDVVKDCIQEVFFDLWQKKEKLSVVYSVKGYLIKCLRNKIFKDLPKWKNNEQLNEDYFFTVEFNVETKMILELDDLDLRNKIKNIINGLPARQREIMYLRFYENLNFDQIAAIMDINRQSIHNLLQKAYENFRTAWLLISLYVFFVADSQWFTDFLKKYRA